MGEYWIPVLPWFLSLRGSRTAGAGEGNRTLVISLEGFCSAIELHPPRLPDTSLHPFLSPPTQPMPEFAGGGGWIRTNVGARPTDLQSAPFSRSGTPPAEPEIMSYFRQLGKNQADFTPGAFRIRLLSRQTQVP